MYSRETKRDSHKTNKEKENKKTKKKPKIKKETKAKETIISKKKMNSWNLQTNKQAKKGSERNEK